MILQKKQKKIAKNFIIQKNIHTFATANETRGFPRQEQTPYGVLVQLVRMPACHAGGHGFESRTHRQGNKTNSQF